jgi:hypothetical protein
MLTEIFPFGWRSRLPIGEPNLPVFKSATIQFVRIAIG